MRGEDNLKIFYAISLAWQLGFLVALPIAGFMWLGWWGDKFWHTSPIFLLVGVAVGLVVTVTEVHHMFALLLKDDSHAQY